MTLSYSGVSVVEDPLIERGAVYKMRDGSLLIHPMTMLRVRFPNSPVWCERTLGHREQERERRLRRKGRRA